MSARSARAIAAPPNRSTGPRPGDAQGGDTRDRAAAFQLDIVSGIGDDQVDAARCDRRAKLVQRQRDDAKAVGRQFFAQVVGMGLPLLARAGLAAKGQHANAHYLSVRPGGCAIGRGGGSRKAENASCRNQKKPPQGGKNRGCHALMLPVRCRDNPYWIKSR
jgi:hypothetical protein